MENFVMSASEEQLLETLIKTGLSLNAAKAAVLAQREEQEQPTETAYALDKEEFDVILEEGEEEFLYEVTEQQKKGYFYNLSSAIVHAARPVQRQSLKRALNKEGVEVMDCANGVCTLEYKRGHLFTATLRYDQEDGRLIANSTEVNVEWNNEILETEARGMVADRTGLNKNNVEEDGNVFFATNEIFGEQLAAKAEVMNNGRISLTYSHDINAAKQLQKKAAEQQQNAKEVYEFVKANLFNAILLSDIMAPVDEEKLPAALSMHTIALIEQGKVIFVDEDNIMLYELNMKTKQLQLIAQDLQIKEESGTQVKYEKVLVDGDGNEIETGGAMLAPGTFTKLVTKKRIVEIGEGAFATFLYNHHKSVIGEKKKVTGTNIHITLTDGEEEFEFSITTADSAKQRGLIELID